MENPLSCFIPTAAPCRLEKPATAFPPQLGDFLCYTVRPTHAPHCFTLRVCVWQGAAPIGAQGPLTQ